MKPKGGLVLFVVFLTAATLYMAFLGARSSWQYYLTAEECLEKRAELQGARVRVSGVVAPGTLQLGALQRSARFAFVTDAGTLKVEYSGGRLPDNLREGTQVVVEGRLEGGERLQADKLLTRCASKYESKAKRASDEKPVERVAEEGNGRWQ